MLFVLAFRTKAIHFQGEINWVRLFHVKFGSDSDRLVLMKFHMFDKIFMENMDGLWEAIHPLFYFVIDLYVV